MTTASGEELDLLGLFALPPGALDWQQRAACAGHKPADDFYPRLVNRSRYEPVSATATALCASCPVRVECVRFGLTSGCPVGVHGGFNMGAKPDRERARAWLAESDRRTYAEAS